MSETANGQSVRSQPSSTNGRSVHHEPSSTKAVFIRTIIPFLLLQFSVGLCASLQATFYPIEARKKGATAAQFGAVFGIIHLSLFIFGEGLSIYYVSGRGGWVIFLMVSDGGGVVVLIFLTISDKGINIYQTCSLTFILQFDQTKPVNYI